MDGSPSTGFWGKLRRDPESGLVLEWHPLRDHCADVAAVAEALLRDTSLGSRIARLAGLGCLDEVHVQRLSTIAALHDLGKFNRGFQNKAWLGATPVAGHVAEAAWLLGGSDRATDRLAEALRWKTTRGWSDDHEGELSILHASICHHGRPATIEAAARSDVWQSAGGLDPFVGIADLRLAVASWFPAAFGGDGAPLPSRAPEWVHAYAGLVMLADWIGSDTRFFPYSTRLEDRMPFARTAAHRAMDGLGLRGAVAQASLQARSPTFQGLFGFPPRPVQAAVEGLPCVAAGGVAVLESETGSGKTEAALVYYAGLARRGLVDGLYFALPTRTAAVQIHRRIRDHVARMFGPVAPQVVLAVPGYLRVDNVEGQRLAGFDVLWNDDPSASVRFRGWAAENPKRFLAAPIAVGTIDQALLGVLCVSHAHLRRTCLLRQLLVVDEVHASDAYMGALLETLLGTHVRSGGQVLLMSATLGAVVRERLLAAGTEMRNEPDLAAAVSTPYPRIEVRSQCGATTVVEARASVPAREVEVSIESIADDPIPVASKALELAARGARVLVVRNTVSDCVTTQVELERLAAETGCSGHLFRCGGVPAPHHSRFTREDREALDQALEASFGPTSDLRGCVVVATQTIQQSLDIDADVLLTDLCPMDVLLQRIGRVHRHADRLRVAGCERPRVWILVPSERDLTPMIRQNGTAFGSHGLGTVYEDLRCIDATWRILESRDRFEIPANCRDLVERSTHPQVLAEVSRGRDARWQRHGEYIDGIRRARVGLADLNTLDWGRALLDTTFPEHKGQILARLGELDRIVDLPLPVPGPFGGEIRTLQIPHFLARGMADPPGHVTATQRGDRIEILIDGRAYGYNRHGLRNSDERTASDALADE